MALEQTRMANQFPSAGWLQQFVEEINHSEAYAKAAQNWEGDVLLVVEGQNAAYLDLWHGQCRQAEFVEDPGTKQAEFTITAALETWQKVLTNRLDPMQGMMAGQLKLKGNLVKLMQHMRAAQELMRCATRIDTVFANDKGPGLSRK
jgi:putative sterol carrier protein